MDNTQNLSTKWWHRVAQVAYIFFVIWTTASAISFVIELELPTLTFIPALAVAFIITTFVRYLYFFIVTGEHRLVFNERKK